MPDDYHVCLFPQHAIWICLQTKVYRNHQLVSTTRGDTVTDKTGIDRGRGCQAKPHVPAKLGQLSTLFGLLPDLLVGASTDCRSFSAHTKWHFWKDDLLKLSLLDYTNVFCSHDIFVPIARCYIIKIISLIWCHMIVRVRMCSEWEPTRHFTEVTRQECCFCHAVVYRGQCERWFQML